MILPKFAHLYPASAAVVVSARVNNFRPTLNEYTVEFADHSKATVLEFQIIDNGSSFTTAIARVIFDSRQQPAATQTRGPASGFQMILQTAQFDLDMTIKVTKSRASIMGQVLERSTKTLLKNFDVTLMKAIHDRWPSLYERFNRWPPLMWFVIAGPVLAAFGERKHARRAAAKSK